MTQQALEAVSIRGEVRDVSPKDVPPGVLAPHLFVGEATEKDHAVKDHVDGYHAE